MENLSLSTKAGNAVVKILEGVPEINPLLDSPNGKVRREAVGGIFTRQGSSIVSQGAGADEGTVMREIRFELETWAQNGSDVEARLAAAMLAVYNAQGTEALDLVEGGINLYGFGEEWSLQEVEIGYPDDKGVVTGSLVFSARFRCPKGGL